jgi:LuxR family transcriptional regulator, maltose regulon positive regulatory protein
MDMPIESLPSPSREFTVSRLGLLWIHGNHAVQAVSRSSNVVTRRHDSGAPRQGSRPQLKAIAGPHDRCRSANPSPSPNSLLARAWRNLIELRLDDASAVIAEFERAAAHAVAPISPRALEFAELLRAFLIVLTSDDSAALRAALGVLESRRRAGEGSPALAAALRVGYWKVRDFDRYYAVPRLRHAIASCRCTHGFATIIGSTFEALVEADQLRFNVATRIARGAHQRAVNRFGKRSPVTARAAIVLAELLYEEGHHAELDSLVMESLALVRASGDQESALRGYRVLAGLAARRGDTEFAFLILNEAEGLAAERNCTRIAVESLMLRARLLLNDDRAREAAICIARVETLTRDLTSNDALRAGHGLVRAQLLIATGDARQAATILRELQASSCGQRNQYWAMRLSIHLADALLGCGDQAEGRAMLIQALQVGSRAGVYQIFVDAGAHVADLLLSFHNAIPQGSRLSPELRPYIGSILAERAQQRMRTLPGRAPRVKDSLSPRECSVLRSMSSGLSNKRIAQELQIAPETVKSHVKGIFIKLSVQTRAHAVSTAGALGLL